MDAGTAPSPRASFSGLPRELVTEIMMCLPPAPLATVCQLFRDAWRAKPPGYQALDASAHWLPADRNGNCFIRQDLSTAAGVTRLSYGDGNLAVTRISTGQIWHGRRWTRLFYNHMRNKRWSDIIRENRFGFFPDFHKLSLSYGDDGTELRITGRQLDIADYRFWYQSHGPSGYCQSVSRHGLPP